MSVRTPNSRRYPLLPPARRRKAHATRHRPVIELLETRVLLDAELGGIQPLAALQTESLVRNLDQELGGRSAVADELTASSRAQVAKERSESPEYRANEVRDAYWTLLGQAPSPDAVDSWLQRLDHGVESDQLVATLLGSSQYYRLQGGDTQGWIEGMYRDVLGRLPDAAETQLLSGQLADCTSREALAEKVVNSPEAKDAAVEAAMAILASAEYAAKPAETFPTGALLVQFEPGMEAALDRLQPLLQEQDVQIESTQLPGLVRVEGDASRLVELHRLFSARPYVDYAEPERILRIDATPNDFYYSQGNLYGLNGTFGIRAPAAWDVTTGSTAVTIADIDTGVDYTHPDLYKNIWINQGEIPANVVANIQATSNWDVDSDGRITFWDLNDSRNQGSGKAVDTNGDQIIDGRDILASVSIGGWSNSVDGDGNGYVDDLIGWNFVNNSNNPMDDHGHGTHTAGTFGAIGNNSVGLTGVNWKTQIMPLKFLAANGSGTDAGAALAVQFAANHGARVSNNSYGSGDFSPTLYSAINAARSAEHIFVAAAGNSGLNADVSGNANYPSGYNLPNILSVAATDGNGNLAGFSNYGATTVDLGAPGVSILSSVPGGYAYFNGTSMATPHVAGTAALVLARYPNWTYAQVTTAILSTVTPASALVGKTVTGGIANAAGAVNYNSGLNVVSSTASGPNALSLNRFTFTFSKSVLDGSFTLADVNNLTGPTGAITATAVNKITATSYELLFPTQNTSGTYTVSIGPHILGPDNFAMDQNGNAVYGEEAGDRYTGIFTLSTAQVIDDGDPGFSTTGSWQNVQGPVYGEYFQSDTHFRLGSSGNNVASWTFEGLTPGFYDVSVTWVPHPNRATNAQYTVKGGNTVLATRTINQEQGPNDLIDKGAMWERLGNYQISGTDLTVELAGTGNEYLIADAARIEPVASSPEIQVLDGASEIIDGSIPPVLFATTPPGVAVNKILTVKNIGTQNLILSEPIIVPGGYSVLTSFGSATLVPGASTTFAVRLDAAAVGTFSGELSFGSNDSDEDPFNFFITGTVSLPSMVTIIDDGNPGFSTVGSWQYVQGQNYSEYHQSDTHFRLGGSGSNVASWAFGGLTPGFYNVSATWVPHQNRATNAQYTVKDGATTVASPIVNQEQVPNDFSDAGSQWENLGTYQITSSSLTVELAGTGNDYLIADAARIERVADSPEIQLLDSIIDIVDASITPVSFPTTSPGIPVSKTFTVKNVGAASLTLTGPIIVPDGYSIISDFANSTLASGASTTFVVQMDATSSGTFSGELSFGNNDSDENPFNFLIAGTVAVPSLVTIIDNGDPGFTTVGAWQYAQGVSYGEYFQSDTHFRLGDPGNNVSSWTFSGLTPGLYKVSVTWVPHPNRATNAQYNVKDGGTPLATLAINQELAPNDFTDAGAQWETLGNYQILGTSLTVELAGTGNEYLIADAVRIERISG